MGLHTDRCVLSVACSHEDLTRFESEPLVARLYFPTPVPPRAVHLEVVGGNRVSAAWGPQPATPAISIRCRPGALTGRQNTDNYQMHPTVCAIRNAA